MHSNERQLIREVPQAKPQVLQPPGPGARIRPGAHFSHQPSLGAGRQASSGIVDVFRFHPRTRLGILALWVGGCADMVRHAETENKNGSIRC